MSIVKMYVVKSKVVETRGVATLVLTDSEDKVPQFVSGQYITVYAPGGVSRQGRSYSISSAPGEPTFSITVCAMGECSNYLCALPPGTTIQATLPYGFFYPEHETTSLVLIAAGIGITPFRSMLRMVAVQNPTRRIHLLRSIRTTGDALFEDELNVLRVALPNMSVSTFVTREKITEHSCVFGRHMQIVDVLSGRKNIDETEFLISGSLSFTHDMYTSLKGEGVSNTRLHTEAFFSL